MATTYRTNKTTKKIFERLLTLCDYNEFGAAAMMGSLSVISGLDPKYRGIAMSVDKIPVGIGGWTGKNKRTMQERCTKAGRANTNIDIQLQFLEDELMLPKKAEMVEKMRLATDIHSAVLAVAKGYEGIAVTKIVNKPLLETREKAAEYYYSKYVNKNEEKDEEVLKEQVCIEDILNNARYVEITATKTKLREKDSATSPALLNAVKGETFLYACMNEKKTWYMVYVGDEAMWVSARSAKIVE